MLFVFFPANLHMRIVERFFCFGIFKQNFQKPPLAHLYLHVACSLACLGREFDRLGHPIRYLFHGRHKLQDVFAPGKTVNDKPAVLI